MVKPYVSRLRPAEHVPRLRPRARSRFEPARTFPVDGPSTGSLGLSLPPAVDAETADLEIELDEDPWSQPPAGQAVPAATPADGKLAPAMTAVPEQAAPTVERAPAHAAIVNAPARQGPAPGLRPTPTAPPAGYQDPPFPQVGGPAKAVIAGARELPTAPTAAPERRSEPAVATTSTKHGHRAPRGGAGDFRPPFAVIASREHDQARSVVTRHAAPDQPVLRASLKRPAPLAGPPEAAPAEHPPLVPDRHVNRKSRPAEDPADRVQAMARWLRDAAPGVARPETASPPAAAPPGPWGRTGNRPGSTADTEVTVTIGRIEVKAPAAAPAPSPPRPGGPRPRVPTLDDYLESRTRVRGRPG